MKILFFICSTLLAYANLFAHPSNPNNISQYFNTIKTQPEQLAAFLKAMPKGADLHLHPSGATYAENMIQYAQGDELCIDRQTYVVFASPHCDPENLFDNAVKQTDFYNQVIDAWSMRNFQSTTETGHDHFFAAFGKYNLIAKKHRDNILAEVAQRAQSQNESYLEVLATGDGNESGQLGKKLGWNSDFETMRANLLAHDFDKIINHISKYIDEDETNVQSILNCKASPLNMGCSVKIRYLYQVYREQAPEMVFSQLLAGFEAASQDNRVVGLNMVQPEDGVISMRDYTLQMKMVGFLHRLYPRVPISLHAGELTESIVPSEGIKFHINEAVKVANANRIGHGVDVLQEDDSEQLLNEMSKRGILVEINLSSNYITLPGLGDNHPLPAYLQFEVPIALSTDDEGISRSNLTQEYILAVNKFNLNYSTLKTFARNSLAYSFLPGAELWTDNRYQEVALECQHDRLGSGEISMACRAFLDKHEKANLQWDLEGRFNRFEQQAIAQPLL